jgi:hypothetical protein
MSDGKNPPNLLGKEVDTVASITLFTAMAMATTQFACVIGYGVSASWQSEPTTGRQLLRMNWVVVTDKNGSRRLRMQWATSGNC